MVKRNCYCFPIPCSICPPLGEEPAVGTFTASGSLSIVSSGEVFTISGSGQSTGAWVQESDIYTYYEGEIWTRAYLNIFCNCTGNAIPNIHPDVPIEYETEDQWYVSIISARATSGAWDAPSEIMQSYAKISVNDCRNNKPQFNITLSDWQGMVQYGFGIPNNYFDVVGTVNVSFV